jgi:hypothetical protein
MVVKIWSNHFHQILNFNWAYLSNHKAKFGGVFSYKPHFSSSFQKYKLHDLKPCQSKWHFWTYSFKNQSLTQSWLFDLWTFCTMGQLGFTLYHICDMFQA